MGNLNHALEFLKKGYSIIPCNGQKKPILKTWVEFQQRRPSVAEVTAWWEEHPNANIGIVCGAISNLTVVDCDAPEAWKSLDEYIPTSLQAPIVRTPSDNHQIYFKYTPGLHSQNRIMPDTDIKAEGGYVIAPPSVCDYEKRGKRIHGNHRWHMNGIEPPVMPEELANELKKRQAYRASKSESVSKKSDRWQDESLKGVAEGKRNATAAALAGDYIRRGLSDAEVLAILTEWNARNLPPLPERELQAVVTSIRKTDTRKTPLADSEPSIEIPFGFQFVHNADILSDLRPIEWRIRDILTDYSLYYNFGDPGHFKTFVELDRLLCIAAGIDYHGHAVKLGTVFYICGEGWQGIGRRIAAWHIAHGTKAADVPFFVSRTPTQLMDLEAVHDVRRAVDIMTKEYGPPAVVHIDTLARNFGEGDENATKDMNAAISNLDKAFGADFCRGLTHHTGHANKDRARGAMALHGAADGAFRICLTESGQIVVECKKMKDAPTAPLMVFERREVLLQIGNTEDRSYVLDLAAEGDEACGIVKPKKEAELKGGLQKALDILRRLYARYENNLKKGGRSCATPAVSFADWRTACMDAGIYKRTDNFRTAAEKILLHGLIRFDEAKKYVYLVEMVSEDEN
jgi:hypothetical protein